MATSATAPSGLMTPTGNGGGFFMGKWIGLLAGTLAGGTARYTLSDAAHRLVGASFPYGTMAVNLSGCFLIGIFDGLSQSKFLLSPEARVMLMTGFCGAYTTLSTLMLETNNLLKDGDALFALANVGGTVLGGFLFFRAGLFLGEWI